jgi:hypothetical protein
MIQIGLGGSLAAEYVSSITRIEDVSILALQVGQAHADGSNDEVSKRMEILRSQLLVVHFPPLENTIISILGVVIVYTNVSDGLLG